MGAKTVLIIDDDQTFLDLLAEVMNYENLYALKATNGEEAIALIKSLQVDLVIVDYVMPGLNGLQVKNALNDVIPEIPIILCSATNKIKELFKVGHFTDFISKPFDLTEFDKVISRYV